MTNSESTTSPTSLAKPAIVTLKKDGQCVGIDSAVLDLVGGDLAVRAIRGIEDPQHGYRVVQPSESLLVAPLVPMPHDGSKFGRNRFPNAGMIPVLQHLAKERGIDVQIDGGVHPLPEKRMGQIKYPDLIEFVSRNTNGIIRTTEKPAAIAEVLAAFPGISMRVLSNKDKQLQKCRGELAKLMENADPLKLQLTKARHPIQFKGDRPIEGVIFSTFDEVANADFQTADIVLFLNAADCLQGKAQDPLSAVDGNFRLFGFVEPGQERSHSPYERANMMRIFGPEQVSLMTHARSRRHVRVGWIKNRQKSPKSQPGGDFLFKNIWRNEARNHEIARRAMELAAGTPSPGRTSANGVVLVDELDHAVALAKLLPAWRIWAKDVKGPHLTPSSFRTRLKREQQLWNLNRIHIVLGSSARTYQGAYDLDFVIWAGGRRTTKAIPESWLYSRPETMKPLLILDFEDGFNETTQKWSRKRMLDYDSRDIFELNIAAAEGRIRRFLRQLKGQNDG